MSQQNFDRQAAIFNDGEVIGKCRILNVLGQGAMGVVYRGYHQGLYSEVAVKVLHSADSSQLASFFREAQAIARLDHPNIMKIYDIEYDENSGRHYIVTQFIPGHTLEEILQEDQRLTPLAALRAIIEATKGLAYAHQKGIIHRDIKPANLMMDNTGNIKLTDFGLACTLDIQAAESARIMGTPHYMAPEQCRGEKVDARTDIYALGATFYHLLAGRPPFAGDYTIPELLQLQLSEKPPALRQLLPNLPKSIAGCIRKMMNKLPEDRFDNCLDLLEHLQDIYRQIDLVKCPRCPNQNPRTEVFDCPRCQTTNLCLSHLVPQKEYCDQCEMLTAEIVAKVDFAGQSQWLQILTQVYSSPAGGILYVKAKHTSLVVDVSASLLQLQLPQDSSPPAQVEPCEQWRIVQQLLLQALAWENSQCKFYPHSRERKARPFLPPHPHSYSLQTTAREFLKALIGVVRIYSNLWLPGAIIARYAQQSVGILFTEAGIAITRGQPGQAAEFIDSRSAAIELFRQILHRECHRIGYRAAVAFPPIKAENLFPLPAKAEVNALFLQTPWENLTGFFPDLLFLTEAIDFLAKWHWLDREQVAHRIAAIFRWEEWQELNRQARIDDFTAALLLVAIAQEGLRELVATLVEEAQQHLTRGEIPPQIQEILEQALAVSPDNLQLLEMLAPLTAAQNKRQQACTYFTRLGDIYGYGNDYERALARYQEAVANDASDVDARMGLLAFYHQQEDSEKVKEYGLELLPLLRRQGKTGEDKMRRVCEILLHNDSGMIECRKELINFYFIRNNLARVAYHYEILADFYRKSGNYEQAGQCYQRILKLDAQRDDIRHKQEALAELAGTWRDKLPLAGIYKKSKAAFIGGGLLLLALVALVQYGREQRQWLLLHLVRAQLANGQLDRSEKLLVQIDGKYYFNAISAERQRLEQELKAARQKQASRSQDPYQQRQLMLIEYIITQLTQVPYRDLARALALCRRLQDNLTDERARERIAAIARQIRQQQQKQQEKPNGRK